MLVRFVRLTLLALLPRPDPGPPAAVATAPSRHPGAHVTANKPHGPKRTVTTDSGAAFFADLTPLTTPAHRKTNSAPSSTASPPSATLSRRSDPEIVRHRSAGHRHRPPHGQQFDLRASASGRRITDHARAPLNGRTTDSPHFGVAACSPRWRLRCRLRPRHVHHPPGPLPNVYLPMAP